MRQDAVGGSSKQAKLAAGRIRANSFDWCCTQDEHALSFDAGGFSNESMSAWLSASVYRA